jgi:glycogen operon protein
MKDLGNGEFNALLLIVHGSEIATEVTLPAPDGIGKYELLWNSAHESPLTSGEIHEIGSTIGLSGTSVQLLRAL